MDVNSIKFGVLCYDTLNIGDEIQSLAMKKLLPHVDYYVLRDNMNVVYDFQYNRVNVDTIKEGEINLFMNGWFAHPSDSKKNRYIFPPPSFISPIFLSMHMTDDYLRRVVDKHLDYFRSHGPIGCRDFATLEKLKRRHIPTRFDGCITLTLEVTDLPKNSIIYYVDVKLTSQLKQKSDPQNKFQHVSISHIDRHPRTLAQRFSQAQELLDIYTKGQKIYTSRLHCYLPCKAMGVEVEFVKTLGDPRFSGLIGKPDSVHSQIKTDLQNRVMEIVEKLN